MRNGDLYKIQSMAKNGSTLEQIVHVFRNKYSAEEVTRFVAPASKPKRKRRTKAEMEAAREVGA